LVETEQEAIDLTFAIFGALNNRIDFAECCGDEETYNLLRDDVLQLIRMECGLENEYQITIKFKTPRKINEYFFQPLLNKMAETLGQTLMKQQQNFEKVTLREIKRLGMTEEDEKK